MNRIEQACPGDCARCQLLADGKVDMVPCVLDQLFRRIQRIENSINNLQEVAAPVIPAIAALELTTEEDVQTTNGAGASRRRGIRDGNVAEH